jgi:lipid-A-disaccharide synthase
MNVFISAGEVSGDIAGAKLATELARRAPGVNMFGLGGPKMAAAGVDLVINTNPAGTVGLTEGVAAAPALLGVFRRVQRRVRKTRPAVAVLIANDVFNMVLARWLRRQGVRTVAWFPPQVWVWRSLAGVVARSVDVMLTVFPEESAIYGAADAGLDVRFVGHYLADSLRERTSEERDAARAALAIEAGPPVVGLMPGSRLHEVRYLLPDFVRAAEHLATRTIRPVFVLPVADDHCRPTIERLVRRAGDRIEVRLTTDSHLAMRASDLLMLASGTATLEATLMGIPMLIAYRVSLLSHALIRAGLRAGLLGPPIIGLPNLILGDPVVPEVLQGAVTAETLARHATHLLQDAAARERMREKLRRAADQVKRLHSIERVAHEVLACAGAMNSLAEAV